MANDKKERIEPVEAGNGVAVTPEKYTAIAVIISVIMIGVIYQTNTSSFTVLIGSVAGEMIPKGMNPATVGWLISLPSLLMIPGVLLVGVLQRYIRPRTIVVVSWILYALSGMAIYWMPTPTGIFVCRALMGLFIGTCQPPAKALPSRMYGDDKRAKVMGWISMGGGVISVINSIIVGQLGLISWRLAMFVYPVYALIFIIFALIFVPNLPVQKDTKPAQAQAGAKRPFGQATWMMCLAGLMLFVGGAVIQVETSIQVQELGLGASGASSIVSVFNTIGIIIGGFFFGTLYGKLKRWVFPVGLIISAICYIWFALAHTLWELCLSGLIANIFMIPILMVYTINHVTYCAPPERITTAVTLVILAQYLGQTLTTPFINLVQGMFGATAKVAMLGAGVEWIVLAVIAIIYILATKNAKLTYAQRYGLDKPAEE